MINKIISIVLSVLILAFTLMGCGSEENTEVVSRQPDSEVDSTVTDLQLALLNHISYKGNILKDLQGKSVEGHGELIDDKYKNNISDGESLTDELKGYTLVDFDDGDPTGFKSAAYTKGNSLVIVYCGTDSLLDVDAIEDLTSLIFDFSAQDGQAKEFAKKNIKKYKHHDLYTTGYSLGGRLCYIATEDAYDNILTGNLKRVRTFNALGVKEAFDITDGNLSNIHNLEFKLASKTDNYIVRGDAVSDGGNYIVGYRHIGTKIKVPCTNNVDGWPLKQHDLYSVIDYLLHNPEGFGISTDNNEEDTETDSSTTKENNTDFLIGSWKTSDGVGLTLYKDGYFEMDWGYFTPERGQWSARPMSGDTYYMEMDGSLVLTIMSMIYGSVQTDYHFEALKSGKDSFYLVQVYGEYTAETSPCKLKFTRT